MKGFPRRFLDPGLVLVLALTLFLAIPLAMNPGLPSGSDTLLHSYRVAEMQRSWEHGLVTPRWGEGFYLGYGSPLFHFYASLTYYVTSVLQLFFNLGALDALRWLLLLSLLMCSGGMYLFCKRRSGRLGAVLAGLVYVYSPYLMYTEAYARGAFPELLAFALFPLLLWRIDALRDKPNTINFLIVFLVQVTLINAHNLMAVTFTAIAFAWVVFETLIQQFNRESSQMNARTGALAGLAMLLGGLAAATFWLPILLERDSVHLENLIVPGLLDYRGNFLRLETLLSPPFIHDAGKINGLRELRILGIAQWALAVAGGGSAMLLYIRGFRTRHPQAFLGTAFFALLVLVLIALMLPEAEGVWSGLRPLQLLQFPWRLLGPIGACLAIIASMNGLWLGRMQARFQISTIAVLVALPIVTIIPLLYVPEWRHSTLDTSIAAYHDHELSLGQWGTTATGEFRPRDVHSLPSPTEHLLIEYADGYPIDKLNRAVFPDGTEAELLHNSPQSLAWRINTDVAFTAEIYNFYWHGWRAELDGRLLEISPSAHHGLITVPLPAGEYQLRVYLGSTLARDIAAFVSTLALAITCFVAWTLRRLQLPPRPYWTVAPMSRSETIGILLGGTIAILILLITFREGSAWLNSPPGEALPAQVSRKYTLDGSLQLLGYDLNGEVFKPGDTLVFNAYWYALEKTAIDFSSFLHLSSGGPPQAQADKIHPGGWWGPEGYIFDDYELQLPADLPAGDYQLIIGLYTCQLMPADDCGNGYRPTVVDESGDVIGDSITVTTIRVDEP